MISPRPLSPVLLFGLVPVASWFIVRPFLEPVPSIPALYSSLGFSIFAFLATLHLVPALGPTFIKANLKGKDLLKTYQTPMSVYRDRSNKGYIFDAFVDLKVLALYARRYMSSPSFYLFHLHSRHLFMNKRPSKSPMKELLWWNFHITRLVFSSFRLQIY